MDDKLKTMKVERAPPELRTVQALEAINEAVVGQELMDVAMLATKRMKGMMMIRGG